MIKCLEAADDEPLFVLRATDKLAPALVRLWAQQFAVHSMASINGSSFFQNKYQEAMALADAMEAWPNRKFPDSRMKQTMTGREQFERIVSAPPFSYIIVRYSDDPELEPWPGQDVSAPVQFAWDILQEIEKQNKE